MDVANRFARFHIQYSSRLCHPVLGARATRAAIARRCVEDSPHRACVPSQRSCNRRKPEMSLITTNEGRTTHPRMTAAVVIRLARRLDWLSSYRSVSSTISSAMISSMISVWTCGGPVKAYLCYDVPSRVMTPIAPPAIPGALLMSKRCARPVWLQCV